LENNERRKNMECPVCKSVFPKVKEVLIMADRDFGGNYFIEEDFTGDKWKKIKQRLAR
jgi:hypothetical protein